MRWIALLWMIAGCHEASPSMIDAPDGLVASPGLFVAWKSDPMIPGPVSAAVTLSEVTFNVDHFEVQSDADGGTKRSRYALMWSSSMTPAQEEFPDAPSGLYSRVAITFGGHSDEAFEIRGSWLDAGKATPFRITDREMFKTSFDLLQPLAAGGAATIKIAVDLEEAISGIDFRKLEEEDDVLELSNGDMQLQPFRARLARAFRKAD